ncbi:MAG: glucarate dehydratase [Acidobacteria bacterium]|nr:glucarate dehydratase [Acidobacteriota bacterium]
MHAVRISSFSIHPVAVADPPLRSSYGRHAPYALRTILVLTTTDGITGISEAHGGDGSLAALEAVRPLVEGMDPFHLHALWEKWGKPSTQGDRSQTWLVPGENPHDARTRAFAAVEAACLDIIGKAVNQPVCDLLGGRARDAAPFSAYLFYKHGGGGGLGPDARDDEYGECLTPESMVRQCRQMIATYGFREIKLKGGVLEPALEIETIRLLRDAFGSTFPLRIDPNCAWSVETSVHVGIALQEELSGGGYLEDPTSSMEGMAQVRRQLLAQGIDTPLASNVAVTGLNDVVPAWGEDAVQVVLSDPHYWGGIRAVQRLSFLCEALGMGVSMHSNNHLGVSMMIMAHACAASPAMRFACDTHYPWQSAQDEVLAGGRVKFVDGAVVIPAKPGLGVDLDMDQVARLEERYHQLPYRKRDDAEEMRRHVDPSWQRVLPRW